MEFPGEIRAEVDEAIQQRLCVHRSSLPTQVRAHSCIFVHLFVRTLFLVNFTYSIMLNLSGRDCIQRVYYVAGLCSYIMFVCFTAICQNKYQIQDPRAVIEATAWQLFAQLGHALWMVSVL